MHDAALLGHTPAGGGLLRVRLGVPQTLAASHRLHGQYIELRHEPADAEARKGYFVLTSPPGADELELLMRADGSLGERVATLTPGATLHATDAMGPGFPLELAKGKPLLLVATGSGIGALVTVTDARIEAGEASRTRVLYGVRTAADIAVPEALERWRSNGIDVEICLSRQAPEREGERAGYVQDRAAELSAWLSGGAIFAAGHAEMLQALRAQSTAMGIEESDIFVNQ